MTEEKPVGLGHAIHIMQEAELSFDIALEAVGLVDGEHYERVGWDTYDCSVDLYGVNDDVRLTDEQQRVIRGAGFAKAYVNHKDGWETHYSWDWRDTEFKPARGWRRRWVD